MKVIAIAVCVLVLASAVGAKKGKEERLCPPGMEMKNKKCTYKNDAYYSCKAGEYAKGSTSKCDTQIIVYGNGQWPADTKTTRVWWKASPQQKTCAKTHNIRPGVYCKVGRGALTTFEEAKNFCLNAKGRLCTFEELKAGDTRGTGCNYNWKRVWSSTPCGNNKVWTTSGSADFVGRIGGHKCMSKSANIGHVRCCMDDPFDNSNNPKCTKCPVHTTSNAGAASEDECRCALGEKNDGSGCKEVSKWDKKQCGGGSYRGGSLETCSNLDTFRDIAVTNKAGKTVCASNTKSDGSCVPKASFKVAEEFCSSQGARLCTASEVRANGIQAKCNTKGAPVWTSTKCSDQKQARVVNARNGKIECVGTETFEKAEVMCCADPGQYCAACPANNDGSSGLDSIYECMPKKEFRENFPLTEELEFVENYVECPKNQYSQGSKVRCSELGWRSSQGRSKNVCAESRINGQCSGKVSADEAKELCESVGARLCTHKELMDDEALKSGCDYDKRRVWTANACKGTKINGASFDGFYTSAGSKKNQKRIKGRCEPASSGAFVRCCADQEAQCAKCPANSQTSGRGARSKEECTCKPGYNGIAGGICSKPTKAPTKRPRPGTKPPSVVTFCPPGQFLTGSKKGCKPLGLVVNDNLRNGAAKKVCGMVRTFDDKSCLNNGEKMTYDAAKSFCTAKGMRLCSGMEIVENIPLNHKKQDKQCWGTKDKPKFFWSYKPCKETPRWKGDKSAKREIFYHVVRTPYEGIPRPSGTPKGQGPEGNRIDMEQSVYPETNMDRCESRKPSLGNTNHVACCADAGAQHCRYCPRNSCRDHKCSAGATANTDCPCDDYDDFGALKLFSYNVKTFKVCVPAEVTDSPTPNPTKVPTNSPTNKPGSDVCEANYYYNAAAGAKKLDKDGKKVGGSWSCDFGTKNTKVYGKSVTTEWHKNNPDPKWGPTSWKKGCRGKCLPEKGVSGKDCRENTYKNEWSEQKICVTTSMAGHRYFKANGKDNSYIRDECAGTSKKGAWSGDCCSKTMVWEDAKEYCNALGGRLCMPDELKNSCAERTGCDYDYTWVWSAETCNGPRGAGHLAYPGDQRKWERKFPGDCTFKETENSIGHKACTNSKGSPHAQGMPNNKDAIPYTTGHKTGMGEGGKFDDWIQPQGAGKSRYFYLDAMADLFKWKAVETWHEGEYTKSSVKFYPKDNKPNPLTEDPAFGSVCISSEYPVFVRCCADAGSACLRCPSGKFNAKGAGKDFYTCQ